MRIDEAIRRRLIEAEAESMSRHAEELTAIDVAAATGVADRDSSAPIHTAGPLREM